MAKREQTDVEDGRLLDFAREHFTDKRSG